MSASFGGARFDNLLRRIYAEYAEMPGLSLTHQQAQRLWALNAETCLAALEYLTETKFLCCGRTGQYARSTDGPPVFPGVRMAKVELAQGAATSAETDRGALSVTARYRSRNSR